MWHAQRLLQSVWLLALLPFMVRSLSRGFACENFVWLVLWLILCVATILLSHQNRAALTVSALVALFTLAIFGSWSIYNVIGYLRGVPLYLDSPATIFAVLLVSALTAVPAAGVLVLAFFNRRKAEPVRGARA